MNDKLANTYYSEKGYWKSNTAVHKLAEVAKVSKDVSRKWLQKQALWQIYLPLPNYIPSPYWVEDKPNYIHQADLLFLPEHITYKYALVVVDVASRCADAEPLSKKESTLVAKAFQNIYSRKLTYPHTLMVDPGKEFMGRVTTFMNGL